VEGGSGGVRGNGELTNNDQDKHLERKMKREKSKKEKKI
jgi:hypothetical protein